MAANTSPGPPGVTPQHCTLLSLGYCLKCGSAVGGTVRCASLPGCWLLRRCCASRTHRTASAAAAASQQPPAAMMHPLLASQPRATSQPPSASQPASHGYAGCWPASAAGRQQQPAAGRQQCLLPAGCEASQPRSTAERQAAGQPRRVQSHVQSYTAAVHTRSS